MLGMKEEEVCNEIRDKTLLHKDDGDFRFDPEAQELEVKIFAKLSQAHCC